MIGFDVIYAAIAAIAAIVAIILAAAWAEFGHVAHARTWAVSFALLSLAALAEIVWRPQAAAPLPEGMILLAGGGFISAINTVGFRQRAGLSPQLLRLLLAATVPAVAVVALAARRPPDGDYVAPFCLFNTLMCILAFRTLKGRRHSERLAEHAAQVTLLLGGTGSIALFAGTMAGAGGDPLLPADLLLLGGPAVVTAIGLFANFLIAADLADKVRRLARVDMLTGLLNRRGFEEAATAILASPNVRGRGLALVLIDIDCFKTVNDRFGHPAGDRVLATFAACLSRAICRRDPLARIGGEEFAILLADVDAAMAMDRAEALRAAVAALDPGLDAPLAITASFGVAPLDPAEPTLARWLEQADRALYRAKAAGRDRVSLAVAKIVPVSNALTIDAGLIPRAIGAS